MNMPGVPHVRIYEGDVYIERVPSAWVKITSAEIWKTLQPHLQNYVVQQALKHAPDRQLP